MKTNSFKVGDKVKLKISKVDKKHKKYKDTYKVVEIMLTTKYGYVYRLEDVPGWGTEEMIEKVKKSGK